MNHAELVERSAWPLECPKPKRANGGGPGADDYDAAMAGDEVRVSGLGVFDVVTREARPGRNPQTGEPIDIPASKALRFRGKSGKDQLNAAGDGSQESRSIATA